jgi:hypothetical protein
MLEHHARKRAKQAKDERRGKAEEEGEDAVEEAG